MSTPSNTAQKGSTWLHQKLVDDLLTSVGGLPHVRLWVRVVGFDRLKKIKYGTVGESDLQGIIAPYGIMLCIECKTGGGKQTKEQKQYQERIEKFGGIYILARSVEQVLLELEQKISDHKNKFSIV